MSALLIQHITQIATPLGKRALHGKDMGKLKVYGDGAIYIRDNVIQDIGTTREVTARLGDLTDITVINGAGKCVVPGFVDPHTHFLFGGSRPEEFIDRLSGVPYLELLNRGGGIRSTMQATRQSTAEALYQTGYGILQDMMRTGVTTVEGKSGYGLDLETELKQLRIMKRLEADTPMTIKTTFLGAHAVPPEYDGRSDAYIDYLIQSVLPLVQAENLAAFCDVFCEAGVFTLNQSEKLLEAAASLGFKCKIHADEIHSTGGGGLAARLNAISAEHLLAVSADDLQALAASKTIAVLLPATAFCMRKPFAPARKMIDSGCAVALASDFNPGSCFTHSIALVLALAVISMQMSVEEVLTALTLNAAAAVDCADTIGSVEIGKKADLLLLKYPDYRFLVYHTGMNIVEQVIKDGRLLNWSTGQQ
ncbi:imidazolonepropionase|uniref:Imidazolonepropionase n=1 Tax=Dendrosporobacter quercicolus TaxID=146817 RepID=A0A1G9SLX0_9FIRM|nr:imidazolonepropionase [Dendrosporobacter quercicolus]NSL48678.1 imidazolonepropionase [Dendrosporobacter quercicolus DSM 1736]SDM36307.1 imidazolonepropionase [Dendrosporobacter quercicolus]